MIWLLDVSVLVARLIQPHPDHDRVMAWLPRRKIAVCPMTELGFVRVACFLKMPMYDARALLTAFLNDERPHFIPCDYRALDGVVAHSARATTDIYLANLAASRGWRFATLDTGIIHPEVDLIPQMHLP